MTNWSIIMENKEIKQEIKNEENLPKVLPKVEDDDKYKYQREYHIRNNSIAKSYRINADLEKMFRETCIENGVSQAAVISKLMEQYCKKMKKKKEKEMKEKENEE